LGKSLTLKGNAKTRVTDTTLLSEIIGSSDDVLLKLETNLGLEANQFIFVQGIKCLVTSIAGGATYIQTEQPFSTIQKGAEVTYATISN
jgi:hypothetical protein